MPDTRKIRITFDVDVVLDHDEYSGGDPAVTADDALKTINELAQRRLGTFLGDWGLLDTADFHAEIVK